jgi:hypothetical protein
MNRTILVLAMFSAGAGVLGAQNASQTTTYQGVSRPPADDIIVTTTIPEAKPPAGQPLIVQQTAQPAVQYAAQPPVDTQQLAPMLVQPMTQSVPQATSVDPSVNYPVPDATDGTDGGVVAIGPGYQARPQALAQRTYAYDPDADIVQPRPLRPGELQQGTNIRVHLLERLSTADSERGQPFRTRVATDVLQGGLVLIPAGSEIDGLVVQVSSGHAGGHGTMRLDPESVILPDGTRHRLRAEVTATPGSRTRVVGEGTIRPDSRVKRDGIEYGGAVGSGLVVGAIVGGPGGALAGGLIGAGAVTVHLIVSHPQATLETGTTLVFQLTDPLYLAPEAMTGN